MSYNKNNNIYNINNNIFDINTLNYKRNNNIYNTNYYIKKPKNIYNTNYMGSGEDPCKLGPYTGPIIIGFGVRPIRPGYLSPVWDPLNLGPT